MFKSINLSEAYLKDHKLRQDAKDQYQMTQKNVEKIKRIYLSKIIYPHHQEAFQYVDKLFPKVRVKEVSLYKVASRDLIRMGYGGVEGFYDPVSKIVVISGARKSTQNVDKRYHIEAKITKDEVIVHELCHYCYYAEGKRSISSELREEFAYGWSIGYLRQKEYTDEQIVKYNFLPYLMGLSFEQATKYIMAKNGISTYQYNNHSKYQRKEFNKRFFGKIFRKAKEIAMERGHKLIDIYSRKIKEGTGLIDEEEDVNRFDLLDL